MASDLKKYIEDSVKLDDGPPARYQLQLKRVNLDKESDEESKLRRFTLGEQERDQSHDNKTLLLVGESGSGKTTLINALVNYVMGVEFEHKIWFEVVTDEEESTESQTKAVSVYEVFGFEGEIFPYPLTIIDTPGFGNTGGLEKDQIIIELLQGLFCIPDGVNTVNAVGLVMKASENKLNERTAYILNAVTSLFGKDMEKNIVIMMTHSMKGKPKNALKALENAKILCARDETNQLVYFQFNNRQKETIEDESDKEDANDAFMTSIREIRKFTTFLETTEPQSLTMTSEVMKERIRLTACIQNLKERVKHIEMKQEAIKRTPKPCH
ncbi:hypothetical protein WMY93_000155 [Mugilogobius chulae]|uniref:AIG1-type G domain-containing protein n=1 Tax=Mugilogobius chulae TaxID=88201 RepID=A0AAW0Q985_9GOBI